MIFFFIFLSKLGLKSLELTDHALDEALSTPLDRVIPEFGEISFTATTDQNAHHLSRNQTHQSTAVQQNWEGTVIRSHCWAEIQHYCFGYKEDQVQNCESTGM